MLPVNDLLLNVLNIRLNRVFALLRSPFEFFVQLASLFFLLFFIKIDAFLDALGNQPGLFLGLCRTLRSLGYFQRFFLRLRRWFLITLFSHNMVVISIAINAL